MSAANLEVLRAALDAAEVAHCAATAATEGAPENSPLWRAADEAWLVERRARVAVLSAELGLDHPASSAEAERLAERAKAAVKAARERLDTAEWLEREEAEARHLAHALAREQGRAA